MSLLGKLFPARVAHAHCDIPCGIYDPHAAQIAALTVIRMNQLINNLKMPGLGSSPADMSAYGAELSRLAATKEQHAELVKHEVRIIAGDYFKPEHAQKYPDLFNKVNGIMKLASTARQKNDLKAAQDLLAAVQEFAVIFWETKGIKTRKQPSGHTVGGELVYPLPA